MRATKIIRGVGAPDLYREEGRASFACLQGTRLPVGKY